MPYNGTTGLFTRIYNWQTDKANGIKIRADRMDGDSDGFATGLSTAICKDGQTTATANLPMGGFKHTNVAVASARTDYLRASQQQDNDIVYFTTTGTIDAYELTPSPAITAYAAGQKFDVKIHATSTSATPTLAISGLAAKTIIKPNGAALDASDLTASGIYPLQYDGTNFQIVGGIAASPLGLADGGVKTSAFTAVVNTRYIVNPGTVGLPVTLPASSGNQGKFVLLVKIGNYNMNLCGTVNGATSTIAINDRQTLLITATTIDGWV